jgi:predicted amidohydrolase
MERHISQHATRVTLPHCERRARNVSSREPPRLARLIALPGLFGTGYCPRNENSPWRLPRYDRQWMVDAPPNHPDRCYCATAGHYNAPLLYTPMGAWRYDNHPQAGSAPLP